MTALAGWENFFVIVGSSAGALIGLQFVVITLLADMPVSQNIVQAGGAFATPTIVHFSAVLLLSAIQCAPWHSAAAAAVIWGCMGLGGIVYEIIVAGRMRRQTVYKPEFYDWCFHLLLPLSAYATLAGSAYAARSNVGGALFGVAAAALVLLFVGIHNCWDAVTYHVFVKKRKEREPEQRLSE
jgi:hypothetical protein